MILCKHLIPRLFTALAGYMSTLARTVNIYSRNLLTHPVKPDVSSWRNFRSSVIFHVKTNRLLIQGGNSTRSRHFVAYGLELHDLFP